MLPPPGAIAAGGLYTATEFDVQGLDALRPSLVEMGRAVVREDHRNGGVVLLMWAGILAYLDRSGYDYVTGCVSVPVAGADDDAPGSQIRGVRDFVRRRHAAPAEHTVYPYRPVTVDGRASRRHRSTRPGGGAPADAGLSAARARRCAAIQPTIRTSEWATSRRCWTNGRPTSDTSDG